MKEAEEDMLDLGAVARISDGCPEPSPSWSLAYLTSITIWPSFLTMQSNHTILSMHMTIFYSLPYYSYHAYDHPYHALPEVEASKGFSTIASNAIPGQCSGLRAILHRSRGRLYAYQPKAPRCAQPQAIPNRSSNVLAYQGVARS